MKVIADFSLIPLGVGISLSPYIAECEKILKESGLKIHLHAHGTNIEGEWDEVMTAIRQCHEVIHQRGVPRISSFVKIGTRVDRDQTMEDKVRSVEEKLSG